MEALEKKGIVLSEAELAEKLITDDLIMNVLLLQLDKERGIIPEGRYYHWTYYSHRAFKETETKVKAYKLVWCIADDEPRVLGLMDCYHQRKYDEKLKKHETRQDDETLNIKCSRCLKLVSESEKDNCEECDQIFCKKCLTYYGELAFCLKCEKE